VTDVHIEGGRVLLGNEIAETSLRIAAREIGAVGPDRGHSSLTIDAGGLLVLPGIVDLHGDAFERQMMPRPGVDFPVDVALVEEQNTILVEAVSADGVPARSGLVTVNTVNVKPKDVMLILSWDKPHADFDLHRFAHVGPHQIEQVGRGLCDA